MAPQKPQQSHGRGLRRFFWPVRLTTLGLLLGVFAVFSLIYLQITTLHLFNKAQSFTADTLVIYIFAASDPEYEANLHFFIREGLKEQDGNDYLIIVQRTEGYEQIFERLPELPRNARYIPHDNECFDLGTVGWVLQKATHYKDYKYVLWLNSSVRGPYLPAYLRTMDFKWTTALTSKINDTVKLVGGTINCGGAHEKPPMAHVQSYLAATDQVGLSVLRAAQALECYDNMKEVVLKGELGATEAIRKAGYTIDSLMLRYQDVDWTDPMTGGCNSKMNPLQESAYDGININPLETMFVKVKASMKVAQWGHVVQAVKYDEWLLDSKKRELQSRKINDNTFVHELPLIKKLVKQRGKDCFDHEFYIEAGSHDLYIFRDDSDPAAATWQHFLDYGLAEGRPYKFNC